MRAELLDVIYGRNKIIDMPLHEISEVREQHKGEELEPESTIALLRARIAELEWCYDEQRCMCGMLAKELGEAKPDQKDVLDRMFGERCGHSV